MSAKIEVVKGSQPDDIELDESRPLTIGRGQEAGLQIMAGPVSREHCRVQHNGKVWLLTDLDSRNGTWMGEERVTSRALCHGDVFSLGKRIFLRFTLQTAAPRAAPKHAAGRLGPVAARPVLAKPAAPAKAAAPEVKPGAGGPPEDVGVCSFCRELVPGGGTIHPECREFAALAGKEVSGVRIVERIGGIRPVHRLRAHQPSLKRHVLLHGFTPGALGGEDFRAKLLEEVRGVSKLLHPRILQIHDLVDEQSLCFVVMEYFDGRSLREILKKQAFIKVPGAIQIANQLAEGLAYAESQDHVIDRLDTADIYVNEENQAKLDLFRPPVALTPDTTAVSYLAPEVVSGGGARPQSGRPRIADRAAAARSAVYGAGAIFYHMLAGIPPFEGATIEELMPKVLQKSPPALSRVNLKVSPALARVVERAMSKNPADRPADFRAFQADLRKIAVPGM
ncbi:MAG: FHA domain-containing serine/threonine-protein kinase [Planctomycetes bacterium]|jgi:serine/threonine protein kinase|nr:FHA domain-containing serine/threonine-protein kinase [Planctomycetota bacterium]